MLSFKYFKLLRVHLLIFVSNMHLRFTITIKSWLFLIYCQNTSSPQCLCLVLSLCLLCYKPFIFPTYLSTAVINWQPQQLKLPHPCIYRKKKTSPPSVLTPILRFSGGGIAVYGSRDNNVMRTNTLTKYIRLGRIATIHTQVHV